jgi:DNA-binding CsgD family transcriptional regulator
MNHQSIIRVGIGGGNAIDRAGLAALLVNFPGIEVLASECHDQPTVLIWDAGYDLAIPPSPQPPTLLLVLTNKSNVNAFPPGVTGLFFKEESPDALAAAIRQIARGQQYLSPVLAISILQHIDKNRSSNAIELESLSTREREVLDFLAQGLSNKAIAAHLYLSVRTVEGHLDRLYAHLGVHSRTEAVILAMQQAQDR